MGSSWAVPTIASIQRTNVVLVAVSAAILALFASTRMAVGCMLGGAVVMANLWILSAIGGLLLGGFGGGNLRRRGQAGSARDSDEAADRRWPRLPDFHARARIDGMGFGVGVLTQMAAIIIETGRASVRGAG